MRQTTIAQIGLIMFSKSDFQKASSELGKAEMEVRRRVARVAEIDDAIGDALLKLAASESRISAILSGEEPVRDMDAALDTANTDRDRYEKRIEEYQRAKLHQASLLMAAKILVIDRERDVLQGQLKHYEDAAVTTLNKCMEACRPFIRDLELNTGGAAYLKQIGISETNANMAWNNSDPFDILRAAFAAERLPILGAVTLDSVPKGAPPIKPVLSDVLTSEERAAATQARRSVGKLDATSWTAAMPGKANLLPETADTRYHPAEMQLYWSGRVEVLERSISAEATREYAINSSDGGRLNVEAARARAMGRLERLLAEAKTNLANWQRAQVQRDMAA